MNNYLIKESAAGFQTVSIEASLLSERKIFLTEEINVESCRVLLQQLLYLNSEDPGGEIVLYINCPGGAVYDGLAVYDNLRALGKRLKTVCIGEAASMASIFFLAAEKDNRLMLPHSRIMIHDPALSGGSYAHQKPHQLQNVVNTLNEIREILCNIIKERTGHEDINEIYEKTREDTYFNAEEALEFGLAGKIIKSIWAIDEEVNQ